MNIFEFINGWIRGVESSVVNLVSAIAPWLAPIAPAYMTYDHATKTLHFPVWVAIPVAVVVEILGFSAVSTLMSFWFFNRRNKAVSKKAPTGWVLFAFGFYLALIVFSNVLLDWFHNAEWALVAVRALFTLQTIPAAVIVIARVGHKDFLADIAAERMTNITNKSSEQNEPFANRSRDDEQEEKDSRTYKSLNRTDKYFIVNNDSKVAAVELGVTPRAIQKWRKKVQDEISQGKL